MSDDPGEQAAPSQIDVVLADDQGLFADTVAWALTRRGLNVVAVVKTGAAALAAVREYRPHLVILDIGLPDMSGLQVGRTIRQEFPNVKVLALTGLESRPTVRQAIEIGFHGFISKNTPMSRFADLINVVLGGEFVMSKLSAKVSLAGLSEDEQQAALLASQLTVREREVLALLGSGAYTREIAARLHISNNTVRSHVQSILMKLNLHSRLEAIAFGFKYGLIRSDQNRSA
jgi:DNA-binding NarL/FixJ family response regulator